MRDYGFGEGTRHGLHLWFRHAAQTRVLHRLEEERPRYRFGRRGVAVFERERNWKDSTGSVSRQSARGGDPDPLGGGRDPLAGGPDALDDAFVFVGARRRKNCSIDRARLFSAASYRRLERDEW